jgi:hypothetical protein
MFVVAKLSQYLCNRSTKQIVLMFEFDQYLGFLAFLSILTLGFWLMIFLIGFIVPYWLVGALKERFKELREAKKAK